MAVGVGELLEILRLIVAVRELLPYFLIVLILFHNDFELTDGVPVVSLFQINTRQDQARFPKRRIYPYGRLRGITRDVGFVNSNRRKRHSFRGP